MSRSVQRFRFPWSPELMIEVPYAATFLHAAVDPIGAIPPHLDFYFLVDSEMMEPVHHRRYYCLPTNASVPSGVAFIQAVLDGNTYYHLFY